MGIDTQKHSKISGGLRALFLANSPTSPIHQVESSERRSSKQHPIDASEKVKLETGDSVVLSLKAGDKDAQLQMVKGDVEDCESERSRSEVAGKTRRRVSGKSDDVGPAIQDSFTQPDNMQVRIFACIMDGLLNTFRIDLPTYLRDAEAGLFPVR